MKIKEATYDQHQLSLVLPDEAGRLAIMDEPTSIPKNSVILVIENNQIVDVMDDRQFEAAKVATRVIILTPNWDMVAGYLVEYYRQKYQLSENNDQVIPSEQVKNVASCAGAFDQLLDWMGYSPRKEEEAVKKASKPGKAQHKWSKALAERPFYVDYQGSKATVYWQKRNQLRIEKGAILCQTMPLNKDGSIGFSARLSEKIRQDNQDSISGNQTIEDIILKSVNEMGMFLYYGDTNGWLVLKDVEGKTLNEWTV